MSDPSLHSAPPPESPPPSPVTLKPPSPENLWAELVVAVNYLTRLNLPLSDETKPRLVRRAMTWFPIVGVAIGVFGGLIDWVMSAISLPGVITATFAVIGMLWLTRALHEEELASLVNQYGQSLDREQKIGWLKEERSVRYGTLGVILLIIMKIGAIASFASNDVVFPALMAAGALSRAAMVVAAGWLRPVAGDPVADYFQQPPSLRILLAVIVAIIVTFAAMGDAAPVVLITAAIAALIVTLVGANHAKGYNGPLLGTLQQVVEVAVLGAVLWAQATADG
jgi:adenosylcobinamide-GDP ribazoletransferase